MIPHEWMIVIGMHWLYGRALTINSSNEPLLPAGHSDVSERQHRNVVAHQVAEKELAVEFGNRRNRADLRTLAVHQHALDVATC